MKNRKIRTFGQVFLAIIIALMVFSGTVSAAPLSSTGSVRTAGPDISLPSLSQVVNKVLPSVVYIDVTTSVLDAFGMPSEDAGSGVIFRSDGYILTNKHVVADAVTILVTLSDRRLYKVPLDKVWTDDIMDLAVIKIPETNLPALSWGNADSVNVGDWVIAVGNALGFTPQQGGPTVTAGIVSNLGRSVSVQGDMYYDLIQTDAAINPGNSGGPMINLNGEVIGINSIGADTAQNIGFAISVGSARHVFEDLFLYGQSRHPYFGAIMDDVYPAAVAANAPLMGSLLTEIETGSPAEQAGLQAGDIIVGFGQFQPSSAAYLVKALWRQSPGDVVIIVYWRNGMTIGTSINLTQRPQSSAL